MRLLHTVVLCFGLILFSLWVPIAAATWLPGWHEASCDWHPRCDHYGRESANARITELRAFQQGRATLDPERWTEKERTHLAEVRRILVAFTVFALAGGALLLRADAARRAQAARWAMLFAAACVIILPFFAGFWRDVFHPLLFSNQLWLNEPADTSWWIMPRIYFQYTTALVIGVATLLCALVRVQAMRQLNP